MSHFNIVGGISLRGEVRASGAKNAALPIMAASILADEPVRLQNVPRLIDVHTQAQVLRDLGMRVAWRCNPAAAAPHVAVFSRTDGTAECAESVAEEMTLETVYAGAVRAGHRSVRRMRASFCVLGPLLARRGRAVVPLPGGCNIGDRPVDLHLKGLAALGAEITLQHGCILATAKRLRGAAIDLGGPRGPTVTGTANVMSAAVLARGVTTLHNAAREPEVVDLGRFLIRLGAKIEGLGAATIVIDGVEQLGGGIHRLIPDRIEAATLLMAAAITRGVAAVHGVAPEHLGEVLAKFREAGVQIAVGEDCVSIDASDSLRAVDLVAEPYPGIPTDLQAQWTALLSLAEGTSTVEDRVFPGRFLHVAELNRLGARIECLRGAARVRGMARLEGARVTACDLRASAALVLAGLAAKGRTTVDRVHHLDRGYDRFDDKLRQLGAEIERESGAHTNSRLTDSLR